MTLELRPDHHPVVLPHLEHDSGTWRFLGEPLGPAQAGWPEAIGGLDGTVAFAELPVADQPVVEAAARAGMVLAAPPPRRPSPPTAVVVSPHPDDALLSLGGYLAARSATVVDVFSVERWTRLAYYAARPELTERVLLAEEAVACRIVGADVVLLGLEDAPRRPAWRCGYFVDEDQPDAVLAADPGTSAIVGERLGELLPDDVDVLAPLGAGGHVDHVLCREAVLSLVAEGTVDPARVGFYEDVPPCLFAAPDVAVRAVERRLGVPLEPVTVPVPHEVEEPRSHALGAYRVQVPRSVVTRLLRRERELGGGEGLAERVWRPQPATAGR